MSLTSTTTGSAQIVTVNAERIDATIAIQFKEDMRNETEGGADRVILDLSEVEFIDSSGLGAIVAAMKQLGSSRKMDLAGLSPMVDKVFRLTRMDTVFDLYASLNEATATSNS
ncbi:STAS domain-containing protein [Parasedimentitalea maritima]|uniref:Anti-sigma factor antagonist n=2 Tax=Parasedimentitalea TaxID=2738399 RepID=A0A6L6WHH6_9RHOB|nr:MULTISPECIES: STAS domain-containing protein [Zongyanglinia]KAE9631065.1 anti-sigma factor antagonist [Zongyanglinia marina]MVO16409.1 anti-sigma factor antagonist [Zongyanglinia huanghaiensis]TLP65850.1 STAS domain-containing protein [Zongyanglinia marina]